jgi:tetratricopeptide (TPR) repeat protein
MMKRVSLSSPVRNAIFLVTSFSFLCISFAISVQAFLEWKFTRSADIEGFRRAARIQPLNAFHHYALGVLYLHNDHDVARAELERAVELNRHSADAWLRLADAYSINGDSEGQRRATLAALKAAPKDIPAQWQAANLLFVRGDLAGGLELMRQVVSSDPNRAAAAMQIAYGLSDGDITRTMSALPTNALVRLQLMRWLISRGHPKDADVVWSEVLKSGDPLLAKDAVFYVDSLLERREVARAANAWNELAKHDTDVIQRQEIGNLVINGDFEHNLLNAGFGWRYAPVSGVTVSLDTTTFHAGTRALSLQFDTGALQDSGVFQLVPVQPNSHYALQAYLRAEELESANGVLVMVMDPYSGKSLAVTEEAMGTFPWREVSAQFATPPDCSLIRVTMGRSPANGRIRGRLWLDDLRVEKRNP